jgi:hypothetical protein
VKPDPERIFAVTQEPNTTFHATCFELCLLSNGGGLYSRLNIPKFGDFLAEKH